MALFEMWPVTLLYHIFVPMICCKILHLGFYDNGNAPKDYPIVSINRLENCNFSEPKPEYTKLKWEAFEKRDNL